MVLGAVVATIAFAGLTVGDGTAAAAKGVHFDPESPAGTEYALPLSEARKDASGQGGSDREPGAAPPLFGVGVSKAGAGAQEGTAPPAGENRGGAQDGERESPGRGSEDAPAAGSVGASEDPVLQAGDGYSAGSALAWVAAIVLLGGCLALGLRGLQRWAVPGSNQ